MQETTRQRIGRDEQADRPRKGSVSFQGTGGRASVWSKLHVRHTTSLFAHILGYKSGMT